MSDTEKMNEAMYERLGEIVFKAANTRTICNSASGADEKNLQLLAAFRELRQMCEFYKPAAEPIVPGCPSLMPRQLPGGFDGVGPASPTGADKRKHTMDFGRFHVTRAAIPGTTILTFRRKRELLPEFGTVVPGRIIVAKIFKADVGNCKPTNQFVVKSYEAGEHPRVLFSGQTCVSMSKTEKMVYKMVKCNVKETQRRHVSRKRA